MRYSRPVTRFPSSWSAPCLTRVLFSFHGAILVDSAQQIPVSNTEKPLASRFAISELKSNQSEGYEGFHWPSARGPRCFCTFSVPRAIMCRLLYNCLRRRQPCTNESGSRYPKMQPRKVMPFSRFKLKVPSPAMPPRPQAASLFSQATASMPFRSVVFDRV